MIVPKETNLKTIPAHMRKAEANRPPEISFRFPRAFFYDPRYKNLPMEAEWLYAVLMYRGRRFADVRGIAAERVCFSTKDVMRILHAGIYTATARLRQLEGHGLIRYEKGQTAEEGRIYLLAVPEMKL